MPTEVTRFGIVHTVHFVDPVTGSDGADGETLDTPWKTWQDKIIANTSYDFLCIRRNTTQLLTATISIPSITAIGRTITGWPRGIREIPDCVWTQGSTVVTVAGFTMEQGAQAARMITAPDGHTYFLTRVVSSTEFRIDRKYIGDSTTGTGTIDADEWYDILQTIDDSGWTVKLATWNTDPDNLHKLDREGSSRNIYLSGVSYDIGHIHTVNGTNQAFSKQDGGWLVGCIFETQGSSKRCLYISSKAGYVTRCVMDGTGTSAIGIGIGSTNGKTIVKDVAMYNLSYGFYPVGEAELKNVNIGSDGDYVAGDTNLSYVFYANNPSGSDIRASDLSVKNDDYNKLWYSISNYGVPLNQEHVRVDNFGKVLGWSIRVGHTIRVEFLAGSSVGRPTAEFIASSYRRGGTLAVREYRPRIFEQAIFLKAGQNTLRYYVSSNVELQSYDIHLIVDYISSYVDNNIYGRKQVQSEQTVNARADGDDWSQYLEVSIDVAIDSMVHIEVRGLSVVGSLYIDPNLELT